MSHATNRLKSTDPRWERASPDALARSTAREREMAALRPSSPLRRLRSWRSALLVALFACAYFDLKKPCCTWLESTQLPTISLDDAMLSGTAASAPG
jgi:hypothetical protein